jgi:hypothetical protein
MNLRRILQPRQTLSLTQLRYLNINTNLLRNE